MLLLSDLGPYPLNQYGREKGMIHRGQYRRDRATVGSDDNSIGTAQPGQPTIQRAHQARFVAPTVQWFGIEVMLWVPCTRLRFSSITCRLPWPKPFACL